MIPSSKGRPSHKELTGKLEMARKLAAALKWLPAQPEKLDPQFRDLDLYLFNEKTQALLCALDEIRPDDYAGGRPPHRAYEPAVRDRELFAFTWNSPRWEKAMYLKFCLCRERLFIVSFHESPDDGGRVQ